MSKKAPPLDSESTADDVGGKAPALESTADRDRPSGVASGGSSPDEPLKAIATSQPKESDEPACAAASIEMACNHAGPDEMGNSSKRSNRRVSRSKGLEKRDSCSTVPGAFSGAPGQCLERVEPLEYNRVYHRSVSHCSTFSDISLEMDESEMQCPQSTGMNGSSLAASNALVPMPPGTPRALPSRDELENQAKALELAVRQNSGPSAQRELSKHKESKSSCSFRTTGTAASTSSLYSREELETRKRAMGNIICQSTTFSPDQLTVDMDVVNSLMGGQAPEIDIEANKCVPLEEDLTENFTERNDSFRYDAMAGSSGQLSSGALSLASLPIAAEVVDSSQEFRIEALKLLDLSKKEAILHELVDDCTIVSAVSTSTIHVPTAEKILEWTKENKTPMVIRITFICLMAVVINYFVIFLNNRSSDGNQISAAGYLNDPIQSKPTVSGLTEPMIDDITVLAAVPATICYEAAPMMGKSKNCPPQPLGSSVANLVAQARLWSIPEADVSILNAGEVQGDIPQGNLTVGVAKTILPFVNNTLVLVQTEGAQITMLLERALQKLWDDVKLQTFFNRSFTGSSYPYGAGIRFSVDMSQPFPQRVTSIQVKSKLLDDDGSLDLWQPLDLQKGYNVVTSSYLASGGDGYLEFLESPAQVQHTGMNAWSEFVSYCLEKEILHNPPGEDFSTQSYAHAGNLPY